MMLSFGEVYDVSEFGVDLVEFKIVYVVLMKVLVVEIMEKLGKRLVWLGVRVREYMGDMYLMKREVVEM